MSFTRLSDALFDAILASDFTKRQQTVLLAVIRYTIGFQRVQAELSNVFLSKRCNLDERHVRAALKDLSEMGCIVLVKKGRGSKPGVYRIVEEPSEWLLDRPKQPSKSDQNSLANTALDRPKRPSKQSFPQPQIGPKQPSKSDQNSLATYIKTTKTTDLDYPTEDLRSSYQTSQSAAAKRRQKKILDCWKIICDRCLHLASTPPPQTRKTLDAWITRSQLDGYTPQQIQQACFDSATAAMERRARDPSIRSTWRLAITELDAHLRRPPPQTLYEQLT